MKQLATIFFLALSFGVSAQIDKPACANIEPEYINRMPGFSISECKSSDYNEKEFIYYVGGKANKLIAGGHYREVWYRKNPEETNQISSAQLLLNYSNAFLKINGKILADNKTFMTASINGKEVYMQVSNSNSVNLTSYNITIVEVDKMKQDISVNLQEAIDRDGKIALYGILFDTNKSDIKPESASTLKQLVDYLNSNPQVNIFVVGHTDNIGDFDSNDKLSKDRASSVVNYLVQTGKISSDRIIAKGVGPLCPVSTNQNEQGRSLNRRVEIVKR